MEENIRHKIQQVNNALNQAVNFINQAKNLMKEVEAQAGIPSARNLPGVLGKFMGEYMETEAGEKIDIPANYASKSTLVYGDKLKQYEENGEKRFKQIERIRRLRVEGILAKKEGKWHAVTSDGSYRVLDVSVNHYGGVEGDPVVVLLPLDDKFVPFAAVESIPGKTPKSVVKVELPKPSLEEAPLVSQEKPKPEPKKVVAVVVENKPLRKDKGREGPKPPVRKVVLPKIEPVKKVEEKPLGEPPQTKALTEEDLR
ncbi:hypothetical protein A2716_00290 [candidate division WWE3 bacterium RIFCSPHIGHO2_01_FULL_40_23]|uniref:50S ribosomal protein L7/L12 n=1 Tax=candidate division WWE3 bacterium RIFCSPLOWO2_01_FULL_41_18 TaxID=1802625 RepID=A0A1F4VE60_UNCKA|nr:MAG: hypothetical protein A2716_00290 [candidate division WWE3 bacterium RIFCSPHIGHO2_01_FULL_40_23]OGC55435.1 MAG: hypothetical protein A3A78_00560 [candidate division WWE3 bacterium RIFCSPLOWO2_01_FULL_41_18]